MDARLRFAARFGIPPAGIAARVPSVEAAAAAGHVRAIVRVLPGGRAALEQHGARIGTVAGDVVTATIPLAQLPALATERSIVFLEAAAWLDAPTPPMETRPVTRDSAAVDDAGFHILRQRTGDAFDGATGAGVVIGFYDSGIDPLHGDFLDASGRSRIIYAWDQTVDGAAPGTLGESSFTYGTECTAATIDAGTCPLNDINGHGTHVAGVAAGDGSATGNGMPAYRFMGAAPEAHLIVVKGGNFSYTSDRLMDGVAYIFARAAELGLPAVVNLSIGTQSGPHDGSTVFERGLQNLLGDGRILVAAAGNQGNNETESPPFPRQSLHAMGDLDDGIQTHELVVPAYSSRAGIVNDGAVLELWYDGGDDVAVGVRAPSGALVARILPGDSIIALSPEGAVYIDNASDGTDPNSGKRLALISVFDAEANAPPVAGAWRIELERAGGAGTGEYHMWLVGSNLSTPFELPTLRGGATNTHLVALPGTAARVVTVGSHVTRHEWQAQAGPQEYPFREALGDLAHFSSPGPRTDGVLKPELTAPGKVVLAARSRAATLWNNLPNFVDADGVHAVNLGTSMSAPYVAGAVALLLQYAPHLTPEEIRALLTQSARVDAFTPRTYSYLPAGVPNVHWGHGKLDASAALHLLPIPSGTVTATVSALQAPARISAAAGTRVPLLRFLLTADSTEAAHVRDLHLDVTGDLRGTVLVIADEDNDGAIDGDEPVVGRGPVWMSATVTVPTSGVVARGGTGSFIIAVELDAGMQHGARFALVLDAQQSSVVGTLSGVENTWAEAPADVASATVAASVLSPDQRWSMSENPIRSGRLILSFSEPPRAARIYSLTGRLIHELELTNNGERAVWQTENGDGTAVASGVYLLRIDFADGAVTQKLMILRGSP